MISLNPGEKKKPLGGMVASGGELSRIMLAVKSVLADKDEVETTLSSTRLTPLGISGRTAAESVRKRWRFSGNASSGTVRYHLRHRLRPSRTHTT
ncbi:MAG: hypothetical protein ACLUUO_16110 [Sellimonas intestinalis]